MASCMDVKDPTLDFAMQDYLSNGKIPDDFE